MEIKSSVAAQVVLAADDSRPADWPVSFYVCAKHKQFFIDYDEAILDETKPCCVCKPCENDSLGG